MSRLPLPVTGQIERYEGDILEDVIRIGTIRQADRITGGLSKPNKMPEWAYNIPATRCLVGSILHGKKGTVCSDCYARKGRFRFPDVEAANERRYQALSHPLWVPAMVLTIRKRLIQFFRWHTSGDLASLAHLQNIIKVAGLTPQTRHWLPTREYDIVRAILEYPDNLVIRVSAHKIDGEPPKGFYNTSRVVTEKPADSLLCPAPEQENTCGGCRSCWDPREKDVAYLLH